LKLLYCSIVRHCEKMLCWWMSCSIIVAVEWLPHFKKRSLTITDRWPKWEPKSISIAWFSTTTAHWTLESCRPGLHCCPHIWRRSKIFCTVITLLSSFVNNYLNVKYFSMISHDTKLMVIHEWYYHCCSQLISLCDYHTDTITDWMLKSMYIRFDNNTKFHKHSQFVSIILMLIVEPQDGNTYRTCLKDFKGILFF
jgi:hypothetical protein